MRGACSVDGSSAYRALSRRLTAPAKRAVQAQAVASDPGRAQPTRLPHTEPLFSDPTSVPRIPGIKDGAQRTELNLSNNLYDLHSGEPIYSWHNAEPCTVTTCYRR